MKTRHLIVPIVSRFAVAAAVALAAMVFLTAGTAAHAAILVQDLFDGVANGNSPLNGQNDSTAVAGLTGAWTADGAISTANNFDVLSSYGPASNAGQVGGIWYNSSNNWNTGIYATRAMTSSINLGQAGTYYLSFKGVRGYDSAGFVGCSDSSGNFIDAGWTWSNAISIGGSGIDVQKAAFIGQGTLAPTTVLTASGHTARTIPSTTMRNASTSPGWRPTRTETMKST